MPDQADVIVTVEELDKLMDEMDQLRAEVALLNGLSSLSLNPEGGDPRLSYDEVNAPVIDRATWVAFVQFIELRHGNSLAHFAHASDIGREDPIPIRITQEEIDILNSSIQRTFGPHGVTVQCVIIPQSSECFEEVEQSVVEAETYIPCRSLEVGVKVSTYIYIAAQEYPTMSKQAMMSRTSAWQSFLIGLGYRVSGLEGNPGYQPHNEQLLFPAMPSSQPARGRRRRHIPPPPEYPSW